MSAAEWLAALGAVPQRRRSDRWRGFSCRKRIGDARSRAAGCGSAAGRNRAARRYDASPAHATGRQAARRRSAPVGPASGRSAKTQSRADQRRPCRVPVGFHGALPRRAAWRRRSAAMSAAEWLPALGAVPQCRRGDRRWRSSCRKRILRRPEQRRRAHPDPRSVRGRRLDRCRCCAPARHSTSCGSAAWIGADCVVTFRRAEAGSLLASRKTPRTCHLIVPRRSPPHAGSVEIVFQKPAIPVIAAMRLQLAHGDGVSAAPRIV